MQQIASGIKANCVNTPYQEVLGLLAAFIADWTAAVEKHRVDEEKRAKVSCTGTTKLGPPYPMCQPPTGKGARTS